jgi:hypothetical protein
MGAMVLRSSMTSCGKRMVMLTIGRFGSRRLVRYDGLKLFVIEAFFLYGSVTGGDDADIVISLFDAIALKHDVH